MEGKQEIDESIFACSRVFVDDYDQAINAGETEIPIKKGVISKQDIVSEMGDVISGNVAGRLSDNDITIFDSTGIALQDLIVANLALHKASEKGVGKIVEL
jgi:ornithine cyclodeaminase/alanine dehydrogenase